MRREAAAFDSPSMDGALGARRGPWPYVVVQASEGEGARMSPTELSRRPCRRRPMDTSGHAR